VGYFCGWGTFADSRGAPLRQASRGAPQKYPTPFVPVGQRGVAVHKQSEAGAAGAGGGTVANTAFTLLVDLLLRFRRSMAQQSQATFQEAVVTAHRQSEPTYQHRSETSGRVGSCEKRKYASQSPIHCHFCSSTSTRAWRPCRQLDVQQNQVHCYYA